jgi:hypothetical protein
VIPSQSGEPATLPRAGATKTLSVIRRTIFVVAGGLLTMVKMSGSAVWCSWCRNSFREQRPCHAPALTDEAATILPVGTLVYEVAG